MFDKRLLAMVPQARRFIIADVALQWIGLLANIILLFLIGAFLQSSLAGEADAQGALALIGAAAAAIIVRMACQSGAQIMGQKAATAAKQTVRSEVYGKLVKLGPAYSESVATAEAVQVCVEGTEQLESYFGSYLPQLLYAVAAPLTLFACLAPVSLPAALALLVCVPFIPVSIMAVQKIAKRTMRTYWGSYTDLGALFLESIQGLTTLKIYQADEQRHRIMNDEAESFRRATMNLLKMQLNSITIMDLFAFGGAAVGIIVVLMQFAAGSVGFAGAFTIVFLSAEFFIPLRTLGSFFHTAMNGMAAAEKMFAILDAPERTAGTRTIDPHDTGIEAAGVGYSYDGERVVLENVRFRAPRGSFIGIAGESGSGKSTFAGILSGAHARYTGSVRIGGVELHDVDASSLHETIVTVTHDSYLFKGTLRSNLLLAKPDASDEEMTRALEHARVLDFVRESGGLDMPITAQGGNLSGGQRQRIAMARALLHDAPVYVFDEATSNIDADSENAIIRLIEELSRTRTVIMVSHRLSALAKADRIYVFENGRVVEAASHAELVEAGGAYARMWEKQAHLERRLIGEKAGASEGAIADADAQDAPNAPSLDTTAPSPATARTRSAFSIMARLVKLTRPLLPVMALAIVLGVVGFLAAIFLTVFASWGLLALVGAPTPFTLTAICILVAICGIVRGPLRYGEQLCNHYLAFRILALVRDKVFAVLRKLAPAKLEDKDKGNLVSLATSDIELLEVFYAHTLSPAAIALVVSLIMTAFIAAQSPLLGLLALAAYLTIGVAVPAVASRASGGAGRAMRDEIGGMNTFVLDSLRGLRETLQFGRASDRARELSESMKRLAGIEESLKGKTALFMAATGAAVMVFDIAMVTASTHLVAAGSISFSQALLATAALMSSFGPVIAVANLGSTLQQTLASGARVLDLIDETPQTEEIVDGADIDRFTGVSARDVDFSYGNASILENVNLTVEPGEIVQIAGRSGAGKSTLLKLIMRFWDPDRGVVSVSGKDVRRVNTASLRATEGFMTQDTHLFTGTIRDNLLIARPDATDAELEEALDKAALTALMTRLLHGIDTPVGELGDFLSGGERQRIGLARVFLHDAPLVLLDEPTSNLDSLSEAAVLGALADNREGKTIVIVSHRPSASRIADRAYSVEHGRVS